MNHEKKDHEEKAEHGAGSLQRETKSSLTQIREKIRSIREGHATGGYCNTEDLKREEQKLWNALEAEIKSADREGRHTQVRIFERERAGLSYRPKLVVAADQTIN